MDELANAARSLLSSDYMPHGNCYLWQPALVGLHAVADAAIAIAYFSIPLLLVYFIRKRTDVPFKGIFVLFGAFILSCGTTHFLGVWTLWHGNYWLSGGVKAFTALISVYTAIELVPLLPKALALPSPAELAALNTQLEREIAERTAAELAVRQLNADLEARVAERTADLEAARHFTERIANLTPSALYLFDLAQRRYSYVNRFASELLGYGASERRDLDGEELLAFVHADDIDRLRQHLTRLQHLPDERTLEIEYRVRDRCGHWHWLLERDTIFERDAENVPRRALGCASDISARKSSEQKLQTANAQLAAQLATLEATNAGLRRLSALNEFLQACTSVREATDAAADLLAPLFPHLSGGVYLLAGEREVAELITSWGDRLHSTPTFVPNDCWGLRRGGTHLADAETPNLRCPHTRASELVDGTTLCLPMQAHSGETIGLLYLQGNANSSISPSQQQLAIATAEQLALSLANLRLRETLAAESIRDPLTGLYNRRHLEIFLERALQKAIYTNEPVGAIVLDVDRFKHYNDTYGHEAGDLVLKRIAQFISSHIRDGDLACRYGGEELVVVLPDAPLEVARSRAEAIRAGIASLDLNYGDRCLGTVTVSAGVASFPDHGSNGADVLRAADLALYRAKAAGRDRVAVASASDSARGPSAIEPAAERQDEHS